MLLSIASTGGGAAEWLGEAGVRRSSTSSLWESGPRPGHDKSKPSLQRGRGSRSAALSRRGDGRDQPKLRLQGHAGTVTPAPAHVPWPKVLFANEPGCWGRGISRAEMAELPSLPSGGCWGCPVTRGCPSSWESLLPADCKFYRSHPVRSFHCHYFNILKLYLEKKKIFNSLGAINYRKRTEKTRN